MRCGFGFAVRLRFRLRFGFCGCGFCGYCHGFGTVFAVAVFAVIVTVSVFAVAVFAVFGAVSVSGSVFAHP